VSKHQSKLKPMTKTNGLAKTFLHPPQISEGKSIGHFIPCR